jgi:2-methylisocitrate lyase-like PEP mutase family enzyme
MTNQAEQQTAVAALRAQLAEPGKIVVCPGVYDGFTARIALKAGFDCLYMVSCLSIPWRHVALCILLAQIMYSRL